MRLNYPLSYYNHLEGFLQIIFKLIPLKLVIKVYLIELY